MISIVAVFAILALPAFRSTATKSVQTKALNNAKQIGFACNAFATDNNGHFPAYVVVNGTASGIRISDYSNTAFDQLIPTYLSTIQPFYLENSAWTPKRLADPSPATMAAGTSLPAGSNEWAYVAGLSDTSNSDFPLIADGFADPKGHAYTMDQTERGGVWKGRGPIVILCDDSAYIVKCDPWTHKVPGSPNGVDLFDTSGQPGWMSSTGTNAQTVLNPR